MGLVEEIEKLNDLKRNGAISEQEYQEAKTLLLAKYQSEGALSNSTAGSTTTDVNTWAMFIHLSQLSGFFLPLAGIILPIILWQVKKDESEIIDRHGRHVANWIISLFIYGFAFSLLCFILVGIPLVIALLIADIVFPIIGAVKANDGEVWPYPSAIRFFK